MNFEPVLIAHWPLAEDARDAVGDYHGFPQALTYTNGPHGISKSAASFDGRRSHVRIADHPNLRLGTGDFTLTAWIQCEAPMTHIFGDVLSKFDPSRRIGLNLHVAGSSPAYSAMSDQRHIHFGIDAGHAGSWEDLGKPEPTSSHVTSLLTWKGKLYAGIADAATPDAACRVFCYEGDQSWHDCGRLCTDPESSRCSPCMCMTDTFTPAAAIGIGLRPKVIYRGSHHRRCTSINTRATHGGRT